jgi:hypothetical protein
MIAALPTSDAITVQQWVLLVVLALIVLIFVVTRGQRRGRDGSVKQYRREIDSATAQSEGVQLDMEQLLVELEALSQKINGQIDNSLAKLRETTVEADRRITALRILIAESKRQSGESGTAPPAPDAATQAIPPTEAADRPATEPARQELRWVPTAPPPMPEQRHQRIYELADRGLTAVQIAQELQTQPGEIELILNLRKVES